MRLLERTLQTVRIAPQKAKTDALGAAVEGFSDERTEVRARVIPSSGGLEDRASGQRRVQCLCLLMPPGAVVAPGDGLCIGEERVGWRCVDVQKWSAHLAVQAERLAEAGA